MSRILNLNETTFFLGPIKTVQDEVFIKQHSIQLVVNCTKEQMLLPPAIHLHTFPIEDDPSVLITPHLPPLLEAITHSLAQGCTAVYFGCQFGVSRSASFLIATLMLLSGLDFDSVYQVIVQKRPVIDPNPGFLEQLQNLKLPAQREEAIAAQILAQVKKRRYACKKCGCDLFGTENVVHGFSNQCMFYIVDVELKDGCPKCGAKVAKKETNIFQKCTCKLQEYKRVGKSEILKFMVNVI